MGELHHTKKKKGLIANKKPHFRFKVIIHELLKGTTNPASSIICCAWMQFVDKGRMQRGNRLNWFTDLSQKHQMYLSRDHPQAKYVRSGLIKALFGSLQPFYLTMNGDFSKSSNNNNKPFDSRDQNCSAVSWEICHQLIIKEVQPKCLLKLKLSIILYLKRSSLLF